MPIYPPRRLWGNTQNACYQPLRDALFTGGGCDAGLFQQLCIAGGGQGPRNFRQIVRVDWYCFIPYLSKGRREVTCSEYRSVRCRMRFEA